MSRLLVVAVTFLLIAQPAGADDRLAGSWKLTVPLEPGKDVTFLVALAQKDGTWTGRVVDSTIPLKVAPAVAGLRVTGTTVRFALELDGHRLLSFDGVLAADGKTVGGSVMPAGGRLQTAALYPSKLKDLGDEYEVAREAFAQADGGQPLFDAAFAVLARAAEKKLPAAEARAVVDRVNAAAARFGPRWERETSLRLAETLAGQPGLAELALLEARRAEKLLQADDDPVTRMRVLDALTESLVATGRADEARLYLAELNVLEAADYAEYAKTHPAFNPEPFRGRKGKSDRAVLVEVFTGAECPPCAAVDLACDGLMRSYTPAEMILLEYHCHIPVPDPLASPAAQARLEYYTDEVEGAPTVFLAGRVGPPGGGPFRAVGEKYQQLRGRVDALLEKPAGVKLALAVGKADRGFAVKASVADLEAPGPRVALRFALAESRVRFAGGNGVRYHHMVVRAMPGGPKGFPLTKRAHEQTVAVDPAAVRAELAKYLDQVAKEEGPFPRPDRPLTLTNLKVVAFVQNDETKEVLHAVQADLK